MTKFISLVIVIVLILSTLCGCGGKSKAVVDTSSSNNSNNSSEEIDITQFKEVVAYSDNIDVYREEVSSRLKSLKEDESFIKDEEWEAISNSEWLTDSKFRHNAYFTTFNKLYEETYKYYYPVVFRDENLLILWYTTESGVLHFEKLHGYGNIGSNYAGSVHHNTSDEEILSSKPNYTLTYDQNTGKVNVYQFGKIDETFTGIPKGSVYCGFSYFEGYIFRNGTDVYSLNAVDTHITDGVVKCIAHNVKYVIDADYYFGSDPWCQPLFQMTDGSIKCYVGWEGPEDAAPDDSSHLCDLQYEGSYRK